MLLELIGCLCVTKRREVKVKQSKRKRKEEGSRVEERKESLEMVKKFEVSVRKVDSKEELKRERVESSLARNLVH